jgi:hypothetical protein
VLCGRRAQRSSEEPEEGAQKQPWKLTSSSSHDSKCINQACPDFMTQRCEQNKIVVLSYKVVLVLKITRVLCTDVHRSPIHNSQALQQPRCPTTGEWIKKLWCAVGGNVN